MLNMSIGIGEHILRAAVVYVFLFLLLRFVGKKHVGELAPFDLLVLLILSETVQNAMVGDDKSLIGGLVSAATLIALAQAMSFLSWRSKRLERLIEGTPRSSSCVTATGTMTSWRVSTQILQFDRMIMAWHRSNEVSKRLDKLPGVGPALATALVASVADPKAFRSGRNFSAWIGLVPKQNSSGACRFKRRCP